ncbi:hypothetical protein ABE525_07470 [Pseudomonas wadenswilerensis]|jgi:hypothetical protein|uniref:Heme exporter protein D n=1 Tax=Pseudomonas wadenswilerensis TaxID=1785161 RepID=A0A380T8Q8_9PSED|nr:MULTISPECIES: hypothetical protein [Pseudomonas]MCE5983801.1 hypothetical protein [Pseudomonas sp. LF19]UVM24426.1 hypothetical protein LOY45_12985 [Pseudomonas wadenswilerensis]SPO66762.1 conserved exported protein of unknown function [Pseudomonas sp. JV241A]SUQ65940.1 hypothetical protein CCOS864_05420 [Pseudomonas wadenswilerensis]
MMNIHWGYLLLAAMLVASVGVLAWGAAVSRRRRREESIARQHDRDSDE